MKVRRLKPPKAIGPPGEVLSPAIGNWQMAIATSWCCPVAAKTDPRTAQISPARFLPGREGHRIAFEYGTRALPALKAVPQVFWRPSLKVSDPRGGLRGPQRPQAPPPRPACLIIWPGSRPSLCFPGKTPPPACPGKNFPQAPPAAGLEMDQSPSTPLPPQR
jgi:hypothetical protein